MKKYLIIASVILLTGCINSTNENLTPTNDGGCIEIYQPVCGKLDVQCFAPPCYPIEETFANSCFAKKAGAYELREGECK